MIFSEDKSDYVTLCLKSFEICVALQIKIKILTTYPIFFGHGLLPSNLWAPATLKYFQFPEHPCSFPGPFHMLFTLSEMCLFLSPNWFLLILQLSAHATTSWRPSLTYLLTTALSHRSVAISFSVLFSVCNYIFIMLIAWLICFPTLPQLWESRNPTWFLTIISPVPSARLSI